MGGLINRKRWDSGRRARDRSRRASRPDL